MTRVKAPQRSLPRGEHVPSINRLPNGSLLFVDSPLVMMSVLFLTFVCFAVVGWLMLRSPHPHYLISAVLILASLLVAAALLSRTHRTFLFEPAQQRLVWTSRGLLGQSNSIVSYADIVGVRLERFADADEVKYCVALVTSTGSVPLSGFSDDRTKVDAFAASLRAVIGRDPQEPLDIVDYFVAHASRRNR